MPTRILYWNIQQFGESKIFQSNTRKRSRLNSDHELIEVIQTPSKANDRFDIIIKHITKIRPAIFVIVEVKSGRIPNFQDIGTLVSGNAQKGCIKLLKKIRSHLPQENWRLVPPLITGTGGRGEGIAFFYRSQSLQFLGPFAWTNGGRSIPMNGIAVNQIGFYPRPWGSNQGVVNCLPSRPIPPNFGFPNGTMESNLAAQYLFQNSSQQNLYFPFHTNRSPLLVIFRELNNPNRIIKVLGFHAPPDAGQAQIAINRISQIHEIQNIMNNEVQVIVGDFNIDILNGNNPNPYQLLTNPNGLNFIQHINVIGANNLNYPNSTFFMTHMKSTQNSTPWNSTIPPYPPPPNPPIPNNGYPGFDYMGSSFGNNQFSSIDNILTKHGQNAGNASNITIINPVTGSPYRAVGIIPPNGGSPPLQPAQGGWPESSGSIFFPSQLDDKILLPQWNPASGPPPNPPPLIPYQTDYPYYNPNFTTWNIGSQTRFRGWNNYKKILSTSDHLALAIDV